MADQFAIGLRLPQQDAATKATGHAEFTGDLRMPGMLYAAILRSPHAHARILDIDTSRARRLVGVRAAVTGHDTAKTKFGMMVPDEFVLAIDKVRYVGDEVAVVVATDEEIAREALDLIEVEYEELPAVFDPFDAMQPDAPRIHDVEQNIASRIRFSRGDVDQGFREADHVFEDRYETQAVHQCYVEPVTCLANYDSAGRLIIQAPIQDPFLARATLAEALGMSVSQIRVVQTWIGGAFGSKRMQKIFPICALASIKTGRPVLLTNTRTEELVAGLPRVPMIIELKTGVKRDGTLVAKQTRLIADNGAYCSEGPGITASALGRLDNLYRYQNIQAGSFLVYTNKTPTGAFRGYGNPQMTFAVESQMDAIAARLGMDPVELRLKNMVRAGDTTANGYKITSCGLEECIRQATERAGWEEKRKQRAPNRGLGLACVIHVSGSRAIGNYNGATADIRLHEDGRVSINTGEGELGQGANTALAQIAAEVLGARVDDVRVARLDTEVSPFGLGAWASRVTFAAGNAVKLAAEDVRRQLLAVAAEKLESSVEDLECQDSRIYVKGAPDKALTFGDVARLALFRVGGAPVMGRASFDAEARGADPTTKYGNVSDAYSFGAQVVEVEVDPETGAVNLLNLVSAHDVGRAINPLLVEGQIEGGTTQGLGYALVERLLWRDGEQRITTLEDYKPPLATDVPAIVPILVETHDPAGPYGAKAVGEPPLIPVAAAVANAIFDATGARIKELPMTPENVLRALHRGRVP